MQTRTVTLVVFTIGLVTLVPSNLLACPICFGADPDSAIAQGMNWAVFTLLGITGGVLSAFIGFIMHLTKKSREALGHELESPRAAVKEFGGSAVNG